MIKKIYDLMLNSNITVIASRPLNGKVEVINALLYEVGIKQKKRIMMFGLDDPSHFYIEKLISFISKIPEKEIHQYFYPCAYQRKKFVIQEKLFVEALEQIGNSKIEMIDLRWALLSEDIVDYILNYEEEPVDFIIINSFDCLVARSNYQVEEIIKKIYQYTKKYHTKLFLVSNVDRKGEVRKSQQDITHYPVFKKYADLILLTYQTKKENKKVISALFNQNKKIEDIKIGVNHYE